MIPFLGLITFLLRLTLAIQSQLAGVFPLDFPENGPCLVQKSHDFEVYSIVSLENGNFDSLCETEKEEKSESESDSLADLLQDLFEAGFPVVNKEHYNSFFGSKAKQGNQHLYDLFHSWKVHLS